MIRPPFPNTHQRKDHIQPRSTYGTGEKEIYYAACETERAECETFYLNSKYDRLGFLAYTCRMRFVAQSLRLVSRIDSGSRLDLALFSMGFHPLTVSSCQQSYQARPDLTVWGTTFHSHFGLGLNSGVSSNSIEPPTTLT